MKKDVLVLSTMQEVDKIFGIKKQFDPHDYIRHPVGQFNRFNLKGSFWDTSLRIDEAHSEILYSFERLNNNFQPYRGMVQAAPITISNPGLLIHGYRLFGKKDKDHVSISIMDQEANNNKEDLGPDQVGIVFSFESQGPDDFNTQIRDALEGLKQQYKRHYASLCEPAMKQLNQ
jgi:hypothetical protein